MIFAGLKTVKEEVPMEWRTCYIYIVKLHKKGDLSDCPKIGEESSFYPFQTKSSPGTGWFWKGSGKLWTPNWERIPGRQILDRSDSDRLRIIIEQSLEWQSPLYVSFVDFKKTFDMVDRTVIWRILRDYGIPQKIVNIIQSLYEDTSCRVIHNADLSERFTVNTGVRQGWILFQLVFSLVIDQVIKTTIEEPRGIQLTLMRKLEDLDFADDVSLLWSTVLHSRTHTGQDWETGWCCQGDRSRDLCHKRPTAYE